MVQFCVECRKNTEYMVKEERMSIDIRGKEIEYIGKAAYCSECGEEIYIEEIHDYNLDIIDKAYREKEGLIMASQINEILEKYNIGKKPLAKLLGWGETTIIRYLDGQTPTKQYSEILLKILDQPQYMYEILEKNKDNITSSAYNRIKRALEDLEVVPNETAFTIQSGTKIESVVYYLLEKCDDITHLALQKLLYYSQSFHKVFNNKYLFEDDCEAWVHGPVYRTIYEKYKKHGRDLIMEEENKEILENIELTENEQELLDCIVKYFGCYSGKTLEKMTHLEMPWRTTRIGLSNDEKSERIINKDLIEDYFTKVKDKYKMLNITDIKDYSTDLFNKVNC